jgi:hypothetical protein
MFQSQDYFPATLDSIWTRLSPVPVTFPAAVHVAQLDTQIFVPGCLLVLFLLALICVFKKWQRSAASRLFLLAGCGELVLAGFFLLVSCQPALSASFKGFFDVLQFPYRLVNYVNLSLLLAILCFTRSIDWTLVWSHPRLVAGSKTIAVLAFGLSGWGLLVELSHVNSVLGIVSEEGLITRAPTKFHHIPTADWLPRAWTPTSDPIELPNTEYGELDFTVNKGMGNTAPLPSLVESQVVLPVDGGKNFGSVGTVRLTLDEPTLVKTNVQAFPWNQLQMDGTPVRREQLIAVDRKDFPVWVRQPFTGIVVPPGQHILAYEFRPGPIWRLLNTISWLILILWGLTWSSIVAKAVIRSCRGGQSHVPAK